MGRRSFVLDLYFTDPTRRTKVGLDFDFDSNLNLKDWYLVAAAAKPRVPGGAAGLPRSAFRCSRCCCCSSAFVVVAAAAAAAAAAVVGVWWDVCILALPSPALSLSVFLPASKLRKSLSDENF